jgi:hypothetical protein
VTARPERGTNSAGGGAEPIAPPEMLTEDEIAYWRLWSPLACATGMLHAATVPGFVQLCQVARRAARLWSEIDAVGLIQEVVTIDGSGQEHREYKKHPLMSEWRGLVQRQEAMLARYGLTADGKIARDIRTPDADEVDLDRILAIK